MWQLLPNEINIDPQHELFAVLPSHCCLKVHQVFTHVLELRLEHVRELLEGEKSSRVVAIFASQQSHLPHSLLPFVLLLFPVQNVGTMLQVSVEEETLQLEDIKFGF